MQTRAQKKAILAASLVVVAGLVLAPVDGLAASAEEEIRYLIGSIGRNGCEFVRNDRRYSRREARGHIRSKWRLNEQLVESAEDFIEKIAARSATSGQPYLIRCRGQQERTSRDWFLQLLADYRADSGS